MLSFRKTQRGSITRKVREHYTRDIISCGYSECGVCDTNKLNGPLIFPTTEVIYSQLDVFEHDDIHNVVFLETVLDEIRTQDRRIYHRARDLISKKNDFFVFCNEHFSITSVKRQPLESAKSRNDRAFKATIRWYFNHLQNLECFVLIDSEESNELLDDIPYIQIRSYIEKYHPSLLDKLSSEVHSKEATVYPPYLSSSELRQGIEIGAFFSGKIRMNRRYAREGFLSVKSIEDDVIISGIDLNRAICGDVVVIKLLPEELLAEEKSIETSIEAENGQTAYDESLPTVVKKKNRRRGAVVGILQRCWRPLCATLELTVQESGNVLVAPVEPRFPRVRVHTSRVSELLDQRLLIALDNWPRDSTFPNGHIVRALGHIGDLDVESEVLLIEHEVRHIPWSDEVLKCLPSENELVLTQNDLKSRLDLRGIEILSVDPPGCTDIDDALHCRVLSNGNYEVGVHIADVSHYVIPGTPLDEEAKLRGTSVYLVQKRIDMLPNLLSSNLCSLIDSCDRFAFSVIWEMSSDARIIKTAYRKTIIRVSKNLCYDDAQKVIDKVNSNQKPTEFYSNSIYALYSLSLLLRKRRMEAGALTLASLQLKWHLDSLGQNPVDLSLYDMKSANNMVEEFMLLANISVAQHNTNRFPNASPLRRHPKPQDKNFDPLIQVANLKGFSMDITTSKTLATSLDTATLSDFPDFNTILRVIATRCMTQAVYFGSGDFTPDNYIHYGLAAPIYTHFTSPIRRYADILVHRLLAHSLGLIPLPADIQNKNTLRDTCDIINLRHHAAQLCGRASSSLFTLLYFMDKKMTMSATIVAVRSDGIVVLNLKKGLEHSIKLVDDGSGILDEENMILTISDRKFKMFDLVEIDVFVEQLSHRRNKLVVRLHQ